MPSELFIGLPTDASDPEALHLFLAQLVVKLSERLSVTPDAAIAQLQASLKTLQTTVDALATRQTLINVDNADIIISAGYVDTEVIALKDRLIEAVNAINNIHATLRTVGIINDS